MSRPRSAERSEGSLAHAQALPENALGRSADVEGTRDRSGASTYHRAAGDRASALPSHPLGALRR